MLVSILAETMTIFNHLAMVEEGAGLCGLIKEINNCEVSPLNALVFSL